MVRVGCEIVFFGLLYSYIFGVHDFGGSRASEREEVGAYVHHVPE